MLACARSYIEDESRLYEPVLLQLREKSNSMCLVRLAGALYWSHDDLLLQNLVAIVISRNTRIPTAAAEAYARVCALFPRALDGH